MRNVALAMAMAASLFVGAQSQAAVVSAIPGGTVVPFPPVNSSSSGPFTNAGVTYESSYGSSVYGYTGSYGLAENGSWSGGGTPYIGLNASSGSMTLTFDVPQSAVGGFVSYAQYGGNPNSYGTPTMAVYDSANNLIEQTILTFITDGSENSGLFIGFSESSADIAKLVLSNAYIVLRDLTLSDVPVTSTPLPAAFPLFAAGLGFVALFTRRKRQRAAIA